MFGFDLGFSRSQADPRKADKSEDSNVNNFRPRIILSGSAASTGRLKSSWGSGIGTSDTRSVPLESFKHPCNPPPDKISTSEGQAYATSLQRVRAAATAVQV